MRSFLMWENRAAKLSPRGSIPDLDLGRFFIGGISSLINYGLMQVQGRLLSYSIQLARGLGHIHRCGVLHQVRRSLCSCALLIRKRK